MSPGPRVGGRTAAGGPADGHMAADKQVPLGGWTMRWRGKEEAAKDTVSIAVGEAYGLTAARADRDANRRRRGVDQTVGETDHVAVTQSWSERAPIDKARWPAGHVGHRTTSVEIMTGPPEMCRGSLAHLVVSRLRMDPLLA